MNRLTCLAFCLAACVPIGSSAEKPTMGPGGVPAFTGHDFRHAANTPFYCFEDTSPDGVKLSSCHEIEDWCTDELSKVRSEGYVITGACEARDRVTCVTIYPGDASKTRCFATPADCTTAYGLYLDPSYGARREQLTACTAIDRSWKPAS